MFKLVSLNVVYTSKTNCFNEDCGICKESNDSLCINCNISGNANCSKVIGKCGHAYHGHCLNEWLKMRRVCPLDNQVWFQKTVG
jgi:RING-box protein 1